MLFPILDNLYSPLPTLMRLLCSDKPLETGEIVGSGSCLWIVEQPFDVGWTLRRLQWDTRDKSLKKWGIWFSKEIEGLETLIKKYNNNLALLCSEKAESESDSRARIDAVSKVMNGDDKWILRENLMTLFCHYGDQPHRKRYEQLRQLCEIPEGGMDVLEKAWRIGCERHHRWEIENAAGATPYRALDQLIHTGEIGNLETWARKIAATRGTKDALTPSTIHQFLENLIPMLPHYVEGEEMVAKVELALEPWLKEFFLQPDEEHIDNVKELLSGNCKEIAKGLYRFEDDSGKECIRMVSHLNRIQLCLRFARQREKKSHLRLPQFKSLWRQGMAIEIEPVCAFDWNNPPEDFTDQLGKLTEGMPADLEGALRMTGGETCWLFDETVPFDAAEIEAFLHEHDSGNAPTWMLDSKLLEEKATKKQRERVLDALTNKQAKLTDLERESLGAFKALRRKKLSVDQIRKKLEKSNCVLHVL